jgi:hypothetical protein
MAIAFDATTNGGLANPGTSLTFSHTVTGSNPILFVNVVGSNSTDNITGATYNGVSMSLVGKIQTFTERWVYLFVLVGPATGANNVVVSSSPADVIAPDATSYTGAAQSGQPDAFSTKSSSGGLFTDAVTVVAANCWIVWSVRSDQSGQAPFSGAVTTQRQSSLNVYYADSNGTVGTGSQSSTYGTSDGNWGGVMASFAPAVAVSIPPMLTLLGVR